MPTPDQQAAAQDAVSDLIAKVDPGAMATSFVILAEVVDAEGIRAVWSFAAEGQQAWDSLGLLEYARTLEYAEAVDIRRDDDDA